MAKKKKQDWSSRSPSYPEPNHGLLLESLELAKKAASIRDSHLVSVQTKRIVPREQIILEPDLIELMKDAPETVPPIVIAPWGDVHVVVDGHHRLAAAIEAGHDYIWALEAPLLRLKNFEWPGWY